MRCASIDIGTNTLRLLIADRDPGSAILPVLYKRAITRLGGGYTEDAGISPEAAERTVKVLEDFSRLIAENHVQEVFASATSVVRRAKNKESFLSSVSTRTGINPSVISGTEEARLALAGVLSVLTDKAEKRLVIDIGGGSTEFIATRGTEIAGAWSMEMGVVHLTERHIASDPPKEAELSGMEAEITEVLTMLMMDMAEDGIELADYSAASGCVLVGTAGTITTLAALDMGLAAYDRDRVNNYTLKKERVQGLYRHLAGLTLKQREEVLSLEKGREDLIIPGSAIAGLVMDGFGFNELMVSDAGLLEGAIIAGSARSEGKGKGA